MNQVAIHVLIIVLLNAVNSYGQTNNVCSKNEEVAALEIQLDQNADEIGYNLVCDDETIWDVPIGALKEQSAGAWKIERSCIRSDIAICNFTISDDGQDGITGGEFGYFSLSYGATTVAYSRYGKSAPFTKQSYCFGTDCDSPMLEKKEEDEAIKGWKIVDFNETEAPKSDSAEPEEDESDFNVSGVWVVNVTNIKNGDSDKDQDNGKWVVNVTVIEKEDDPSIDNDVEPNDTPQPNENATNKSDSYSHSASSLTIIACVIGSILMVMIVAFFLHKRGLFGRATTHDTIGAVLPVHNKNGKHNNSNDDSDDERSKSSHHNDKVQQAETFVTYDSADSTVRRTV